MLCRLGSYLTQPLLVIFVGVCAGRIVAKCCVGFCVSFQFGHEEFYYSSAGVGQVLAVGKSGGREADRAQPPGNCLWCSADQAELFRFRLGDVGSTGPCLGQIRSMSRVGSTRRSRPGSRLRAGQARW